MPEQQQQADRRREQQCPLAQTRPIDASECGLQALHGVFLAVEGDAGAESFDCAAVDVKASAESFDSAEVLDDTANSNNYPIYWDISNGPSVAFENTLGDVAKNLFAGSNSESFQLYGSGSVSERYPTLILLGFSCLLLLAGARWTAETARNT